MRIALAAILGIELFGWGIAISEDGPITVAVAQNLDKLVAVHMVVLGIVVLYVALNHALNKVEL